MGQVSPALLFLDLEELDLEELDLEELDLEDYDKVYKIYY